MRAISLYQPYATLVTKGIKNIVTRSWDTSHRGYIAIHAANSTLFLTTDKAKEIIKEYELGEILLGKIIGIADLSDVIPVEDFRDTLTEEERSLGDYRDGMLGFCLSSAELIKPVYIRKKMPENKLWPWLPTLGQIIAIE